jgi:cell division protein FtsB
MKKLMKFFLNKYILTGLAFAVWALFFDQNDYMSMLQKERELNNIKDNIAYLNTEITKMSTERNDLLNNPQKLEQYARENYKMKHEGEDIYVIEKAVSAQ